MKHSRLFLILYFVLVPVVLTFIFTHGVNTGEFIFSHDEYILLTLENAKRSFLVQLPIDLGTSNTAVMIVTFFSRLYYLVSYTLGLHITAAQRILYFIKLSLAILLPFLGFQKISKTLFGNKDDTLVVLLISFFYTFNNFSLVYWHGNNFELTLLISYYLAPLTFYLLHKCLFDKTFSLRYLILTELCLFVSSFAFYLFGAFAFFFTVYLALYLWYFKPRLIPVAKRLFLLIVMFVPFLPLLSLIIYEMVFSSVKGIYANGGETYNNLQGGMLYPLFMWFSWGIYTDWFPRNIFTFNSAFKTPIFILSPFVLYVYFIIAILKKNHTKFLLILLLVFVVFVFFVKGAQPPFGVVFQELLDNVVFFRIFRSPDNKFGYALILCLTLGLLSLVGRVSRKIQIGILVFIISIQSVLIISGIAIKGQNTPQSSDRIVGYYEETNQVVEYINSLPLDNKSILPYPPTEFDYFKLNDSDFQIGQELISKKVNKPFLFYSRYSGISKESFDLLSKLLVDKDFTVLDKLPISHILIRSDAPRAEMDQDFLAALIGYPVVFNNSFYKLYSVSTPSYLEASVPYTLTTINDIHYQLKVDNAQSDFTITLNQNYNPLWKVYEIPAAEYLSCNEPTCTLNKIITGHDFKAPFLNTVGQHVRYNTAFNQWMIDGNGSSTRYFILYFSLQSLFVYGWVTSLLYVTICVVVLFVLKAIIHRWK